MSTQSTGDALTFTSIASFILGFQPRNMVTNPNAKVVDQFLSANAPMFTLISNFSKVGLSSEELAGEVKVIESFELRGTKYDNVSEKSCKQAFSLARVLGLNYKDLLRIITQTKSRTHSDISIVELAHYAYQERNSILEILSSLLNTPEPTPFEKNLVHCLGEKKFEICRDMIQLISKIILEDDLPDIESTPYMSEHEGRELLQLKRSENLIYLTNVLRSFTMLILNNAIPCEIVDLWFNLISDTRCKITQMSYSNIDVPELISAKIEALITVNTLIIMGLDSVISSINVNSPYYSDKDCFRKISTILEQDPTNSVVLYMWSFILFTKSLALEETPERELQFVQSVFGKRPISEVMAKFAFRAENAGIFRSVKKLSKALSSESLYSAIISSFATLFLHFVPLNSQTSDMIKTVLLRAPQEFIEKFLTDKEFEKKLTILKAKLPLIEAFLPLVDLTAVHAQFANFEWKTLNTYAVKSKLAELDYDISDADNTSVTNLDLIVLKKEALVKQPLDFGENIFVPLPEDTKGKILPTTANSDEDVIVFMFNYSGWAVVGRVLQNICDHYIRNDSDLENGTRHIMISIIELVTNVVSLSTPIERSMEIIESLSASITEGDVVSIILRIFEHSTHKRNYRITSICAEFLCALFPNFPHFVWAHIARSDLLDRYGKTGLTTTILGSVELPAGRYDFTVSLTKLANDMVTEAVSLESGFPSRTKKELLEKLTAHLIDVSESYQYWRYIDVTQRFELGFYLMSFFSKILYAVYGLDPSSPPKDKITNTLATCGSLIVNAFLGSQAPDVRPAKSLVNIMLSPQNTQLSLLGNEAFGCVYSKLVKCSFELTSLLISVRGLLKMKPSSLEKMVYANSSKMVDIYNTVPILKRHVVRLLHSLVKVPWSDNYLFLLSFLGEKHSEILLNSISSDLESPLTNHKLSKDLYMFFSALMESKQDGLSILFLTGNIASNKTQEGEPCASNRKSILTILKKNALSLDALPEDVGCCLLDALAYAFNTWANAKDCKADTDFIAALLKRIKEFKVTEAASKEEMNALSAKYRLISRIVEIFALYLFTSSEVDSQIFELLNQEDLAGLVNPFFQIDGYNKPLHDSLHRSFEEKWPKLKLSKFTVAPLYSSGTFSQDAIFAISLMDQFFGDDEKWTGTECTAGYRDEIIEASSNLKYVTCQIAAAKAWGALLTTFLRKASQPLKETFLNLASHFLKVNLDFGIEAPLFTQVYCERLELVFYILYSYQNGSKPLPEKTLFELLNLLIAVFKSEELEYVGNISRSTKRNFYRPILRSILLILGFVTTGTHFVEMESDQLLELFELSFCKGVHLIFSEILSDISTSTSNGKQVVINNMGERIQDLFLLLSLFAKIRALNPPDRFNLIMASSLNEVGALKVILNLYSSSHLFRINGEAVFGPLTLTFISELCTIKHIATKFISNGLFAVLLESPLSVAIQEGNIRPEHQTSLHNIWTNGILSIILLLLSEFGGKVLPECCLFVSYFSKQIKSAICRWSDSKLAVSTPLMTETSQLVILQKIMGALDYQDFLTNSTARSIQNGNQEQIELIVGLDSDHERRALKNVLNRLLTHPKYLNSRVVPTTIEEQRLLEVDTTRIEFVKRICKNIKELQESLSKSL